MVNSGNWFGVSYHFVGSDFKMLKMDYFDV